GAFRETEPQTAAQDSTVDRRAWRAGRPAHRRRARGHVADLRLQRPYPPEDRIAAAHLRRSRSQLRRYRNPWQLRTDLDAGKRSRYVLSRIRHEAYFRAHGGPG